MEWQVNNAANGPSSFQRLQAAAFHFIPVPDSRELYKFAPGTVWSYLTRHNLVGSNLNRLGAD